jgi:hypothetical protein
MGLKRATIKNDKPPPPFLFFALGTRSSAAKDAMFFILACAAALFLSVNAALRLVLSFIFAINAYSLAVSIEKFQKGMGD